MSHLHPGNVPSHSSDSYDFSNLPFINLLDKDTSSVEVSAHPISKLPVLEVIELPAKEIQTYAVKHITTQDWAHPLYKRGLKTCFCSFELFY